MSGERGEPIFFDGARRRLFGMWREGASPVVLCPPTGEEYAPALRGLRLLESRLARRGFATLRFDWSCAGDSQGDGADATWEEWVMDVGAAIDEARRRSGAATVTLLGVRLGGSAAAVAATQRDDVARIALWEPVTLGRDFVEEKRAAHLALLEIEERERPGARRYRRDGECLGHPFPAALQEQLRRVNAGALRKPPAPDALLVRNLPFPKDGALLETLEMRCERARREQVPELPPWVDDELLEAAPVPAKSIACLETWIAEESP